MSVSVTRASSDRKTIRLFGCVAVLGLAIAHSAIAADSLVVKAAKPAPAADEWTGFYFGGHVGYTRGNARVTLSDPDPLTFTKSFGTLTGGVQAGYNWLLSSRVLLGVEADISRKSLTTWRPCAAASATPFRAG